MSPSSASPATPTPAPASPPHLARRLLVLDLPPNRRHLPARALRNAARLLRGVTPLVDRFSGFAPALAAFTAGRRYALAVVEHSWCAPYQPQAAAVSARTVLDLHNIESLLHARCARAEPRPGAMAHHVFARASLAFERRWFPRYDCLLTASEPDARWARRLAPASRVLVYPNALPLLPPPPRAERHAIAFSGNLEYHPNLSAVRYFAREVWPRLHARNPGLVWRLIGKNEHAVRRFLTGENIECTGPVPDALAELARVKLAVVPLLAGSGTRLKILEAWAAATPVVSTPLGAEGLGAAHGENILLAEDAPALVHAIETLLADEPLRRRIAAAGRALYESRYTWPAAWSRLDL